MWKGPNLNDRIFSVYQLYLSSFSYLSSVVYFFVSFRNPNVDNIDIVLKQAANKTGNLKQDKNSKAAWKSSLELDWKNIIYSNEKLHRVKNVSKLSYLIFGNHRRLHICFRQHTYYTLKSLVIFDLCLRKTRSGKSYDIVTKSCSKSSVIRPWENRKLAFSNSLRFKGVSWKLRFVTDNCGQ